MDGCGDDFSAFRHGGCGGCVGCGLVSGEAAGSVERLSWLRHGGGELEDIWVSVERRR